MRPLSPRALRGVAPFLVSLVTGLGFGLPAVFGIRHLTRTGEVWTFLGFPTYGHGPFDRIGVPTSTPLLGGFVAVCAAEVVTGMMLATGSRSARRWSHALLPLEVAYWVGFALPFGPPLGLARTILLLRHSAQRTRPDAVECTLRSPEA